VRDLKKDIKIIQKTIKQGLSKLGLIKRGRSHNIDIVSPTSVGDFKDTIVLEPEDLIFTIKD
jgi:hypothetical protein